MIRIIKQVKKNSLGFTLIEVMVVIIMVGILAAIALPIYTNYVYRARTSEAVSTLGAIKTFMMERRTATKEWPSKDELYKEFAQFNELYYFNKPTISGTADPNKISIYLTPNDTFDAPSGFSGNLELYIDWRQGENSGWAGDVMTRWANHLPAAKKTASQTPQS